MIPPRAASNKGSLVSAQDNVSLDIAMLSHPGMVRPHNEDSIFADGDYGLVILADGMGGYNAGEVASGSAGKVVAGGLLPWLEAGRDISKVDIQTDLSQAALLLDQ